MSLTNFEIEVKKLSHKYISQTDNTYLLSSIRHIGFFREREFLCGNDIRFEDLRRSQPFGKWAFPVQHLVEDDACGPHIDFGRDLGPGIDA